MEAQNNKHLHIISFDIPYPANYGGAIDVFYKIKALSEKGIKIYLHCFKYGDRTPSEVLHYLCHKVYYYPRKTFAVDILGDTPYIINSRKDNLLINKLLKNDYPILFEGIHSCYYLTDERLKNRKKIVRMHNVEHDYYENLSNGERNLIKKVYLKNESKKLELFQKNLQSADALGVISKNDYNYFSKKHNNVFIVSAFHPNETIKINEGKGDYILYHGSLEVNENHQAAIFLAKDVFNDIPHKLIIAGNNPKLELIGIAKNAQNIELRTGLRVEDIHKLVREAQINILPTFQATGIKLKLLLALFIGRHCIVNTPMVLGTGLEELCHIVDNSDAIKKKIEELFNKDIDISDIEKRKNILLNNGFTNTQNAEILIENIWG